MGNCVVTITWDPLPGDADIKKTLTRALGNAGVDVNVHPSYSKDKSSFSAQIAGLSLAMQSRKTAKATLLRAANIAKYILMSSSASNVEIHYQDLPM